MSKNIEINSKVLMTPYEFINDSYIGDVISIEELAFNLGINESYLKKAFEENYSLTPQMALRFEKVLGIDAQVLLDMQTKKDLAYSRELFKKSINRLKRYSKL